MKQLLILLVLLLATAGCKEESYYCNDGYCGCGGQSVCPMDCGDRDGCDMDCASADVCDTICDDNCNIDCQNISECYHQCDAGCSLLCNSVSSCTATIGDGSVATCSNLSACNITCTGSCKVNTWDPAGVICQAGGTPLECAGGGAYTCGVGDCSW